VSVITYRDMIPTGYREFRGDAAAEIPVPAGAVLALRRRGPRIVRDLVGLAEPAVAVDIGVVVLTPRRGQELPDVRTDIGEPTLVPAGGVNVPERLDDQPAEIAAVEPARQ
jgi:hypothetical protein